MRQVVALAVLLCGFAWPVAAGDTLAQIEARLAAAPELRAGFQALRPNILRMSDWSPAELAAGPHGVLASALQIDVAHLAAPRIDHAALLRRRQAEMGADLTARLLAADLDRDHRITRSELRTHLDRSAAGAEALVAELFIMGDVDANDELTLVEITRAVGLHLARMPVAALPLFDIDGDGYLTSDEIVRGTTALAASR